MIDLTRNQKSENRNQKPDNTPVGVIILALLPFAMAFWALIEMGL